MQFVHGFIHEKLIGMDASLLPTACIVFIFSTFFLHPRCFFKEKINVEAGIELHVNKVNNVFKEHTCTHAAYIMSLTPSNDLWEWTAVQTVYFILLHSMMSFGIYNEGKTIFQFFVEMYLLLFSTQGEGTHDSLLQVILW